MWVDFFLYLFLVSFFVNWLPDCKTIFYFFNIDFGHSIGIYVVVVWCDRVVVTLCLYVLCCITAAIATTTGNKMKQLFSNMALFECKQNESRMKWNEGRVSQRREYEQKKKTKREKKLCLFSIQAPERSSSMYCVMSNQCTKLTTDLFRFSCS